jgi:hypothetical protein
MSYEKYIKYKSKYLSLKAKIHNERIQNGGGSNTMTDNDFIQTLGSTPNSEIYNNQYDLVGGAKKLKDSEDSNDELPNNLSSSEEQSSADGLPNHLSSSEETNNTKKGGARKLKKKKNVFSESESDSEFNESESSLLSFSSIDSSSDDY